jgi:hypothetical protein
LHHFHRDVSCDLHPQSRLGHVRLPHLQQGVIAAVLQTLILCPLAWLFSVVVVGLDIATPRAFAEHLGIGLVIFLMPVTVRAFLSEVEQTPATAIEGPANVDTPFLRRLDPGKRGTLKRVSADGHQLMVWTDQGESRIRMRFSDALEELEALEAFDGVNIHRSHWVATKYIVSVEVDGRQHGARLSCGTQLPVSPTGLKSLRVAGIPIP